MKTVLTEEHKKQFEEAWDAVHADKKAESLSGESKGASVEGALFFDRA